MPESPCSEPLRRPLRRVGIGLTLALALWLGPAAAKVFGPTTFRLDNGLQVVVIENHRVPAVVQMLWYKVGAADEVPGYSGLAHFFEHLMFKGTKKTPPGTFEALVRRHGGHENAFTTWDHTAFYQVVPREQLGAVMALEADRMTGLTLTDSDIETERQVVLEEWNERVGQNPSAKLSQAMNAALYRNSPYMRPVIGWRQEVAALDHETVRTFYHRHYAPDNAVLVVAGDVEPDAVRALAKQYYGPIPAAHLAPRHRPKEPPPMAASRVTVKDERVTVPSWRRSYLAPSLHSAGHEHADALEVLAEILGNRSVGRLTKALVQGSEQATAVGAWYDSDSIGETTFGFYAVPAAGVGLADLETAMDGEIARLLRDGVTADEVARTVKSMQADAVYARDDLQTGARVLGEALANGGTVEQVETWPERIAAVTPADVLAAARLVFQPDRSVTGLLLPKDPAS
ncbi:MAG: insulinase family protein [Alphaproteobacteria bacterium]|nr:insulinase family protein [Alphaproteobacteria bacterium]MCB9928477.1 insulinase family protein [Alphaproteobacteria bacterium]